MPRPTSAFGATKRSHHLLLPSSSLPSSGGVTSAGRAERHSAVADGPSTSAGQGARCTTRSATPPRTASRRPSPPRLASTSVRGRRRSASTWSCCASSTGRTPTSTVGSAGWRAKPRRRRSSSTTAPCAPSSPPRQPGRTGSRDARRDGPSPPRCSRGGLRRDFRSAAWPSPAGRPGARPAPSTARPPRRPTTTRGAPRRRTAGSARERPGTACRRNGRSRVSSRSPGRPGPQVGRRARRPGPAPLPTTRTGRPERTAT